MTTQNEPRPNPRHAEMVLTLVRESLAALLGDKDQAERLAWALLRQWAGTELRMPTVADIERLARNEAVERRLLRDPSPAAIHHLADHHGAEKRDVSHAFAARRGAGRGVTFERARRSATPGLACRAPRLNRSRLTLTV